VHAEYLIGCDGGRSLIRKLAAIDFPGSDSTTSNLIAEVEITEEPEWGIRRDALGIHGLSRLEDGRVRVLVTERQVGADGEPTLRELSEALIAVYGTDYGIHSPTSISRFTDMTRQCMVRPCGARGFRRSLADAVLHQCIRLLIGACGAPSHHGYQRACDLISGQASTGPNGSPVFVCAGKTDPPLSSHPLADLGRQGIG
jgi:hypothetical protein